MFDFSQISHYAEKIPPQVVPAAILIGASTAAVIGKNYIAPLVGSVTEVAMNTILGCCGGPVGSVVGFAGASICWLGCNTARNGITFMYSYAAKTMGSVGAWSFKHGREFMNTSNPDDLFLESLDKVKDWSKTLKACRNTLLCLAVTYYTLHALGLENAGAHLFPMLPFAAKTLSRWAFWLGVGSAITSIWTDKVLSSVRVVPPYSPVLNNVMKNSVACVVANGTMRQQEVNSYSTCPDQLSEPGVHVSVLQGRHRVLQGQLRDRISRSATLFMLEAMEPKQLERLLKGTFSKTDRVAGPQTAAWVEEQRTLHIRDLNTLYNMLQAKSPAEKTALEKKLLAADLNNIPDPAIDETNDRTMLRWLSHLADVIANNDAVQQSIHNALINSHIEPAPKDWQQFGLSLLQL